MLATEQTDEALKHRFLRRWFTEHPTEFEVIFEAAAEARLKSLRCERLGARAFKLWKTGPGDSERFERLLSERLPATVAVQFGVENSQHEPAPTEGLVPTLA